ncbi:hypothetical protein BGW80DRAFT_1258669 [Lactifluus volemus]|nr:hypothetical protein BGW80DRAFT_1258669 [Lactifluus volemus]
MDDGIEMKGGSGDTSWGGSSDPGSGALATSQHGVENLLTLESDASCEFRSLNIWLEETHLTRTEYQVVTWHPSTLPGLRSSVDVAVSGGNNNTIQVEPNAPFISASFQFATHPAAQVSRTQIAPRTSVLEVSPLLPLFSPPLCQVPIQTLLDINAIFILIEVPGSGAFNYQNQTAKNIAHYTQVNRYTIARSKPTSAEIQTAVWLRSPGSAAHSDLTHSRSTLRCNSHVSAASVSLALSCTWAQSFTHSIGSASRSSIELLLGRTPSSPGAGSVLSQQSPPPSPLGHSTNDNNPLELLNVVLVASIDGKFHALNCLTGAKLWSMPSSPPPSSAPHGLAAAQSILSILEPLVSTKHLNFSTSPPNGMVVPAPSSFVRGGQL